jgi:hypothetical protein
VWRFDAQLAATISQTAKAPTDVETLEPGLVGSGFFVPCGQCCGAFLFFNM